VKNILILGGGFGGLYTARSLERLLKRDADVAITLISRDNFFVMTPLLFEAGSGVLEPRHAVNPIRTLFKKVRFVQAEIERVDLDVKKVTIRIEGGDPEEWPYDQLVIALGGMTNRKIVPGVEHALTFKTLGDAIFLRNHAIQRFERADAEPHEARKKKALTFVVVGAGFVGVELAGELTEFLPSIARAYRHIDPKDIRYELIEAGPRIAPEFEESMSNYIANVFRKRGMNVRTGTPVERIEPGRVVLKGGETIESETIMAVTGVTPSKLVGELPLEKSKRGAIVVDATMAVKDRPGVWALGDCASIPSPTADGKPYPPLAQFALREAKVLARNIVRTIRPRGDEKPEPFVYETKGLLASLGRYNGVGRIKHLRIHGFFAWWMRRSYYLMQMPQWSRRLRIVIDWTVALFFRNDVVQLDLVRESQWDQPREPS
jgi:NADH:quinone reductase (non-electrogenic)